MHILSGTAEFTIYILIQSGASVTRFCYVFPCELRGPAWAVGSYSIGQSAGGTSQHIIIKTLRQIGAPRSVCSMAGRPTLHLGGLSSPLFSSSLLLGSAAAIRLVFLASKRSRRKYCCPTRDCTEMANKDGTWLREISSRCCLTTAGKNRQLLLNKIYIPFLPSL